MHFNKKYFEVDMLLDADNGKLSLCVVGQCDDKHEVKLWNLTPLSKSLRGWVPHFNLSGSEIQLHCR